MIVALVVAVWAALAAGDDETAPSTTVSTSTSAPQASTTVTSTTTTSAPTTSTTVPPTSTTTDEEARVEEVRLILEDLYFRWFQAIYNNDEDAVRKVIATERYLEDFQKSVGNLQLPRAPDRSEIEIRDVEILRDDATCLVTYSTLDVTEWQGEGALATGVNVLLPVNGQWRFGTAWINRGDLWQQDCEIEPEL